MLHNASIIYISRAKSGGNCYMFYSNNGGNWGFVGYGLCLHYGGYLQRFYRVGDMPESSYFRK